MMNNNIRNLQYVLVLTQLFGAFAKTVDVEPVGTLVKDVVKTKGPVKKGRKGKLKKW